MEWLRGTDLKIGDHTLSSYFIQRMSSIRDKMKFVIVKVFVLCHLRLNQRVDWIELSISVSIIKVGIRVGDSHCIFPLPHCWIAPVRKNKAFQRWYGAGNLPVASSCTYTCPVCIKTITQLVAVWTVDVGFLFSSSEILFVLSEALLSTDLRNRTFETTRISIFSCLLLNPCWTL